MIIGINFSQKDKTGYFLCFWTRFHIKFRGVGFPICYQEQVNGRLIINLRSSKPTFIWKTRLIFHNEAYRLVNLIFCVGLIMALKRTSLMF